MNYFRLFSFLTLLTALVLVAPLSVYSEIAMYPTNRSLPANITFANSTSFVTEFINADPLSDATVIINQHPAKTTDGYIFADTTIEVGIDSRTNSSSPIAIPALSSYRHTQTKSQSSEPIEQIYITTYTDISENSTGVSAQARTGIRTYSMKMATIERNIAITDARLISPNEGLQFSPQGNIIASLTVVNNGNVFEEVSLAYQLTTSQSTVQSTTSIVIQPQSTQTIPIRINTPWQPGQVNLSIDATSLPLNPFVRNPSQFPELSDSINSLISQPINPITQTLTASYSPTTTEFNQYNATINKTQSATEPPKPLYVDIEQWVWIFMIGFVVLLAIYNGVYYIQHYSHKID